VLFGACQRLAGPPVVVDLVVVPLREDGHFGIERQNVLIEQVIFEIAAKFVERLGGLRLLDGDEILPDFAIRHFLLGRHWIVGVDVVAIVDEKIRPIVSHRRIGTHATARLVDAPALSGGVAGPHEADRAPIARRGAETADGRLADNAGRSKVLKADAIENLLPGRQAVDQRLGGEIALRQGIDIGTAVYHVETVGGGNLDLHAGRPVGARPNHGRVDRHVARLHAVRDRRPVSGKAQIRAGDRGNSRQSRCRCTGGQ
jgi:hypothetical protein